jgi:hypothetical protein
MLLEAANRIYERIRAGLEPAHRGEIVAIDPDSGDYFLGRTPLEACDEGHVKHPGKTFVLKRVGHPTTLVVGGSLPR